MALSNKRKLAKLAQKKKKRKAHLIKKKKSSVYLPEPEPESSNWRLNVNNDHWHDAYLNESDLDHFTDEDHQHGKYEFCPVDLIEASTSDAINQLAHEVEQKFQVNLSYLQCLFIALNGWNLAKKSTLNLEDVAKDLEQEFDNESFTLAEISECLQYVIDTVKTDKLYVLLDVYVCHMLLTRFASHSRGGIAVDVAAIQGKKEHVLDQTPEIDQLLDERHEECEVDEKLLA